MGEQLCACAFDHCPECNKPTPLSLPKVVFYQQDWIPGYAAFLPDSTTPQPEAKAFCVVNLGALLAGVVAGDMAREDIPYVLADSIVHELVHVLEQWAGVEFNEERVEAVIDRYRAAARRANAIERVASHPSRATGDDSAKEGDA